MDELGPVVGIGAGVEDPLSAAVDLRDRATLTMVRSALERRQVMLAFQPVVLAAEPGRMAFHEGLIRVLDADGRPIPARDFMGAVETRDLGRLLDCAALELGLATLSAVPDLRLAINMSARSIGYPRWREVLRTGLARDPTVGERLILEITEASAMLMPEIVTAFMDEVQREGVAFAVDDFGAGFTSLRYLRDFCFDMMKIDGQFVRGVAADPDNQVLCRAMLSIARHFEMLVVAESVETQADAVWLAEAGVDCLQGYLYGAPTTEPAWTEAARRRA